MNNNINNLKIGGLITSIVLGAGFFSGKELITFFGSFRLLGILGILISSFLIFLVASSVMKITYTYNITTVDEFLQKVFHNNGLLYYFFSFISVAFMFVIFATMTSAFSEIFLEYFNIQELYGKLLFGLITLSFILFGITFLVNTSAFVAPILFLGSITILFHYLFSTLDVFNLNVSTIANIYSNSVVYTSYNILTTISLLVTSTQLLKRRKDIYLSALFGAIGIFLIGVVLYIPLNIEYSKIYDKALPLYHILEDLKGHNFFVTIYIINFLLAIITTGVTSCYGVLATITPKKNITLTLFIILLAICFSYLGFSTFVKVVFPFFGLFGLLEIYFIFRLAIKCK